MAHMASHRPKALQAGESAPPVADTVVGLPLFAVLPLTAFLLLINLIKN